MDNLLPIQRARRRQGSGFTKIDIHYGLNRTNSQSSGMHPSSSVAQNCAVFADLFGCEIRELISVKKKQGNLKIKRIFYNIYTF